MEILKEMGINFVENIVDLPEGAGIFITGYDSAVEELESAKRKGIPVIERPCPWVRQLKKQIIETNSNTHQCIIMIDKDHMVYDCYKAIFPQDTIIINTDNFKERIRKYKNNKAVKLMVYATFRKKDAESVVQFIKNEYDHPNNICDGYHKSLCHWTKQGLLEEIHSEIENNNLDEVWVICSSEGDRSTKSILCEIRDANIKAIVIKDYKDIPEKVDEGRRVGVLLAPIPLAARIHKIKDFIKKEFLQK